MSDTRVLMIETPLFSHFVKNASRRVIYGMEIVDVAGQAQNALELVSAYGPDVLVVDLRSHPYDLFSTLREINIACPRMLIIGRTKNPEIDFALDAVSAGVMGFINDQISYAELVKAIQTIRQGYSYFPENIVHQVVQNLQAQHAAVSV